MDAVFIGMATGRLQAPRAASTMSSQLSKTRLDSRVRRKYRQAFSTGLGSGAYGGGKGPILRGRSSAPAGVFRTSARLVTGLITERGVCPATAAGLAGLFPDRAPGAANGVAPARGDG